MGGVADVGRQIVSCAKSTIALTGVAVNYLHASSSLAPSTNKFIGGVSGVIRRKYGLHRT